MIIHAHSRVIIHAYSRVRIYDHEGGSASKRYDKKQIRSHTYNTAGDVYAVKQFDKQKCVGLFGN